MTAPEVCRGRVSFLYLTGWRDRECGKVGCVEHGFNRDVKSPHYYKGDPGDFNDCPADCNGGHCPYCFEGRVTEE